MLYDDDALLDTKAAAAYLGVEPESMITWRSLNRHNIPFLRFGRTVRYRFRDLRAFVEANMVGVEK